MTSDAEAAPRLALARLWMVVGGFGVAWMVLHGFGLLDPDATISIVLASVGAVVATVVGLRRWRPSPMWPWLMVLGALGMFLLGNVLRLVFDTLGNLGPSRSLWPDFVALPAYLVLAIGMAGIAGIGRGDRDDVDAVLDAVIAALAVLALAWVFIVVPFLAKDAEVSLTVEILLAAYPVASVFVLAMAARLMFGNGRHTVPSMVFSLVAIGALLVGDVIYTLVDANLLEIRPNIGDLPYLLAFLAYAVAVLHPTVSQVSQRRPSDEMAPTRGRLVSVALALCVPTLVLFIGFDSMSDADRIALGVITLLLVIAAVVRMLRALRQHATSQARLAYQATHDALTGMPNRAFLTEHLERSFVEQQTRDGSLSLLHVNIDRFGLVNDTMGHSVGDELLKAVSQRLGDGVRAQDLVGRIGGDEFAVVVVGLTDEAQAHDFGERTRLMFHRPFTVDGADIPVTASVGVSFHRARTGDPARLLRDADTAVNHAKSQGGDATAVFDDSMRERVAERLHLERELRHALELGQLSLHYQPKIQLSDERVVGLEALLRWEHPELGMVRPDRFIPIAEDTGMIVEIGAWVIDRACADLARLRDELSVTNLRVSVNVSARQLRSEALVDTTARALVQHRVSPNSLCLELTESVLMENLDAVSAQLKMLRGYGAQVSIDDFGTGYSSLAYLSSLPVDELKIDRAFVKVLGEDPHAADVIGAVVTLASALDIRTVAEGTETRDQVDQLKGLGCDEAQGFFFARPVPVGDLPDELSRLGISVRPVLRSIPQPAVGRTTA